MMNKMPDFDPLIDNPVLVGWCPGCEFVMDPYPGPGITCDGDDDVIDTPYYHHRYQKRRMWKCNDTDWHHSGGPTYWLTRDELTEHMLLIYRRYKGQGAADA